MNIQFADHSANSRYHLMTQTIIPRPIAWALTSSDLTRSDIDVINLAPFSYFAAVCSDPALLMISVGKKPNGDFKDTLVNVRNNGKMVIHIANETQADLVTQTSASLAHGQSELDEIAPEQLSLTDFNGFTLPRLAQCDIAYACELYEIKEIGDVPQSLIFIEVKQLYLNDSVYQLNNGRIKVDAVKVNPLSRLGASEFAGITAPFSKLRPE